MKTLFQSTLPRRERRCSARLGKIHRNFNPRSREGSDLPEPFKLIHHLRISIHAPAKGATQTISYPGNFNPRSREGSDEHERLYCSGNRNFNPRSREGSDSKVNASVADMRRFQSTLPRRERHVRIFPLSFLGGISIHAPAKGATWHTDKINDKIKFQSTLPRRERRV